MRVTVAIALPARQEVIELELAQGATVGDALERAAVAARFPELGTQGSTRVGIWSRPARMETTLREGDRVEVYRALRADPKAMRRARVKRATRSRSGS